MRSRAPALSLHVVDEREARAERSGDPIEIRLLDRPADLAEGAIDHAERERVGGALVVLPRRVVAVEDLLQGSDAAAEVTPAVGTEDVVHLRRRSCLGRPPAPSRAPAAMLVGRHRRRPCPGGLPADRRAAACTAPTPKALTPAAVRLASATLTGARSTVDFGHGQARERGGRGGDPRRAVVVGDRDPAVGHAGVERHVDRRDADPRVAAVLRPVRRSPGARSRRAARART